MVQVSLDIPEAIYDLLNKLSETITQDVEETINEILDAVTFDLWRLAESEKVFISQHSLRDKISSQLSSGRRIDNSLFNNVLKELDADGLFRMSDMTLDLYDNSIWIYYDSFVGSNLFVDSFDVTFTGLKRLTADCIVEVEEDDFETLDQVKEHAMKTRRTSRKLPEEFRDLDPWEIDVLALDETNICLRVHFSEESYEYLPSIPAISTFFENVLTSAGVSKSIQ